MPDYFFKVSNPPAGDELKPPADGFPPSAYNTVFVVQHKMSVGGIRYAPFIDFAFGYIN